MRMTIRVKLLAMCVAIGMLPALGIGFVAWKATSKTMTEMSRAYQSVASETGDKIDRNIFERYGDVQAFGLNSVVQDRERWYKVGEESPIVQVMNAYVDTYDLYYLTMLVDLEGKLIAVNTRDQDSKAIKSDAFYAKNYAQAEWFKDAVAGKFYKSAAGGADGTVVDDLYIDDLVRTAYGNDGLALGFTAPVKDADGKTIAIWHNVAKFSLVEEIMQDTYKTLKARGIQSGRVTLINQQGVVLADLNPGATGSSEFKHDMSVINKLSLSGAGFEPAAAVARGESGFSVRTPNTQDGIDETVGYARLAGALGFPGMKWAVLVRVHADEALREAYAPRQAVMMGLGVTGLIVPILAILFSATLVRPITRFVVRLKDIAEGEGDLTQRVDEERQDELGELGRWFNRFVQNVHNIIAEVGTNAEEVSAAATEIAASAEEMSASVGEVARQSAEAADSAGKAGKSATAGGEVVQQTVHEIKQISEAVTASAASVAELGRRGDEIGKVISVINDIADQTNLLALNAAIEAARAGEHGRGFAVVADEVRKLAERTTRATEEVGQSIKSIQDETKQAVTRMETGTQQVKVGVELAERAGENLREIVDGAGQVATLIGQISAASEEAGSATSQSSQAAQDLSHKAEQLRELVGRFKTERTNRGKPQASSKADVRGPRG